VGTASSGVSGARASACATCGAGFFSSAEGSLSCAPCPAGFFSNALGATSPLNCSACAAGSYNPTPGQTLLGCIACPVGRASAVEGAVAAAACAPCLPGYAAPNAGATQCATCPTGTFSAAVGALACSECPPGRYNSVAGGASNSSCVACPDGTTTYGTGAILPIQCVAVPHACSPGEQLAAPGGATCVPLACDAPLTPALGALATSLSCAGCGAGTAGSPLGAGGCSPAGCAGMVCPGLLSLPLVNFSAGASGGARAAAAWAAAPPLLGGGGGGAAAGGAAPPSPSMSTAYAGGALVSALFLLALCLACTRACSAGAGTALLKRVDAFSLRPPRREGEPPTLRAAALGGVFTLMGVLTLTTYALYMVLEWRFNNTLVQRSLSTLGEGSAGALVGGAAWAAAPAGVGGASPLLLRVLVDGEPGKCDAPLSWAGVGLAKGGGAWALLSAPSVGGSGVAAHTFFCPACVLTPAAALTASFHYSCQSLLLEAAAGAPGEEGGGGSVGGGPAPRAVAAAPGALLASVAWTLTPLLSVVSNNITARAYVGYAFTGSALSAALAPLAAPSGGGGGLLAVAPAAASVQLSVALPLQTVYTQVTLTQRVPWTQLLANIVGLSGVVGFFGILYGQFEKRVPGGGAGPVSGAPPPREAGSGEGGGAAVFSMKNPMLVGDLPPRARPEESGGYARELAELRAELRGGFAALRQELDALRGGAHAPAIPPPPPPAAPLWYQESDGADVWYKSSAGDLAWELPADAALRL
jgi:hypothetical protein